MMTRRLSKRHWGSRQMAFEKRRTIVVTAIPHYYLEGKITVPFQARCVTTKVVSPLRKGETVEVLRMATEDACEHDMHVQIRWQGRKMAIPLSQLAAIDPGESTDEAIGDWHYWVAKGHCL
jgi:hypothetical protein